MRAKLFPKKVEFQLDVPTVIAALVAGLTAFGAGYNLANADLVITVTEWLTIAGSTLVAVLGVFYQSGNQQ